MRVFKHKQKGADGSWNPTKKWYMEFRDHRGRRLSLAGYKEKRVTEDLLRFVERLVDLRASGASLDKEARDRVAKLAPRLLRQLIKYDILDSSHTQKLKALNEHLADYVRSLRDKQRNEIYVRNVESRTRSLLELCGCRSLPLPSPACVQSAMAHLRDEDGLSPQTVNHYLTGFKQFAKWLHVEGRMPAVSYAAVAKHHVDSDLRHPRRALTEKECRSLLQATANGPVRHKMSGVERAALYLIAITTGLRASELTRLQVGDVREGEHGTYLRVKADKGKNKQEVRQPLPGDAGEAAKALAKGRAESELLFSMPSSDHTAKMVKADLEFAGIPYKDADGKHADFHALRHTFITRLVRTGADAKVVQKLARHSTPMLTLGRYSHAHEDDMRNAVAGAPSLTIACERTDAEVSIDSAAGESLPQILLPTGDPSRTVENSNEHEGDVGLSAGTPLESSASAGNPSTEGEGPITISEEEEAVQVAFKTDAIDHSATPPRSPTT
jgi:integrase